MKVHDLVQEIDNYRGKVTIEDNPAEGLALLLAAKELLLAQAAQINDIYAAYFDDECDAVAEHIYTSERRTPNDPWSDRG